MIEIQHLKKQFKDATPLRDVNATINQGDVITVIGPSGTGKSTLLRCINLLETPTEGSIIVEGNDITNPKCNINRIRLKIGMVFQSFNLYEHLTVIENCMLAQTALLKRTRQEAYDNAMKFLCSVGMESYALQYPAKLSGGQKQRVAIARTLSTDPEIILFDEPTSALDPLSVGEVERVIANLASQGHTMMIVTHSMDFAESISNRVIYLDQGEVYEEGTPEQIFHNPQRERTRKFIHRLSCLDFVCCENDYNLHEDFGKIYTFCSSKEFDVKRIKNICAIYEEFLILMFDDILGDEKKVAVSLEYNATNNKVNVSFVPYSVSSLPNYNELMQSSMEFKLICHYANEFRIESSDVGAGIRYTFDV